MRRVTAFDFDGTLIKGDSLLLFIRHSAGLLSSLWGLLLNLPWLVGMKCGMCHAGKVKERIFNHFFGGMAKDDFCALCKSFAPVLTQHENTEVVTLLRERIIAGEEVCIVSASVSEWIRPWAMQYGKLPIIGTEIEVVGDRLTGRFSTPNCNGGEKPRRLLEHYPERSTYHLEAYGHSDGDAPLLSLADTAHLLTHTNHSSSCVLYFLSFIFFLAITLPLMPTMDDWVYLTAPKPGHPLLPLLMPAYTYWRPFDGLIGYLGGLCPILFPYFNHVLIVFGHVSVAAVLYSLCRQELRCTATESTTAAAFFMLSPGMLGAVLDIDSANQVYSLLFGLMATRYYLRHLSEMGAKEVAVISVLLLTGTLWKENGAVFIAVMPLLAWGTGRIKLRQGVSHGAALALWLIPYFVLRFLVLPQDLVDFNPEYTEGGMERLARNVGMFLAFTWLPIDFVSLLHRPSRNWLMVVATVALALPGLVLMCKQLFSREHLRLKLALVGSMVAIAGIHLATIFTVMHTYSSLSMAAIIVGIAMGKCGIQNRGKATGGKANDGRKIAVLMCWLAAALITDAHHIWAAYQSGETGQRMAKDTISQMKVPAESVCCICIDEGFPKYSMFCTIPADAFGWGEAVRYRTHYKWPKRLDSITLPVGNYEAINNAVKSAFAEGNDCVWMVRHDKVEVVWPE